MVALATDKEIEALVFELTAQGYRTIALVEHDAKLRLSTARLAAPGGLTVDLIAATCGIEREIVDRAQQVVLANFLSPAQRSCSR